MTSPFGKKLLRLFLTFTLVPAVLLTLAGYYVAVETSDITATEHSTSPTELADYFHQLLYDRADAFLSGSPAASDSNLVDFAFRACNGELSPIIQSEAMAESAARDIALAGRDRMRGVIVTGKTVVQYSGRDDDDGCMTFAGFVHSEEYSDLLTAAQSRFASESSRRDLKLNFIYFLATVFFVLAVITVILAYYFSGRFARSLSDPLTALSEASQKIAEGDFDQQVTTSSTGEIQTLITSFNQMARQLNTTTTRLAQTERVAAWRNVARRFAHELKNPLQPILVSLYRIEKALNQSDQYEKIRQPLLAASEEIKHLTTLAERFSELAKLPPPKIELTDLNNLLTSVVELYREQLDNFDFSLNLPTEIVQARIDPTYFREAVHNLLKNAIDASRPGGKIILSLTLQTQLVNISVRDFGAGMSPETMRSARMPYFTTKDKGSGLGLAVVEKTISELGGQVLIDSKPNHGTTVSILLPVE